MYLYSAGIKHNSGRVSKRVGGKILSESSTDNTIASVGLGNPSPHNTDVGAVLVLLSGTIDIGYSLSHVEVSVFLGTNTIQLQERPLRILVNLASERLLRNTDE